VSGLRPRPPVPDEVAAAVRAAVAQLVAEAHATDEPREAWRFSGRWFSAHPIRIRSRPG
jgi:hypothetical protein